MKAQRTIGFNFKKSIKIGFTLIASLSVALLFFYESDEKIATIAYLDEIGDSKSYVSETEKDQEVNQSKERGK